MNLKRTAVDEIVTIVSGLPRSGTSMMMQMLSAGGMPALADHLRRPDEDNPRGYYEFEPVKQLAQDCSWLDEAQGKVVKMVYRLLYDLPRDHTYRVIFMRRELHEVIASQEVMLERQGKAGKPTTHRGEQPDDDLLADIYRRQLDEVMSWLRNQPNFSVMYVDYAGVLSDPQETVHELNRFLDGRLDVDAMLQVPDWSLYRQRVGNPLTPQPHCRPQRVRPTGGRARGST
jgi:hypothetical protein